MEYIDTVNGAQLRLIKEFSADNFKYSVKDGTLVIDVYKGNTPIGSLIETLPPRYVKYMPKKGYEIDDDLKASFSGTKKIFD